MGSACCKRGEGKLLLNTDLDEDDVVTCTKARLKKGCLIACVTLLLLTVGFLLLLFLVIVPNLAQKAFVKVCPGCHGMPHADIFSACAAYLPGKSAFCAALDPRLR